MESYPKTWVEVSASAIRHNIQTFKKLVKPPALVTAVIKSNAYGHGLLEVAKIAADEGVVRFAVDSLDEALKLRSAGFTQAVLVLGFIHPKRLIEAINTSISFVAYDQAVIEELQTLSAQGSLKQNLAKIHLKVETGTVRQGLEGNELLAYAKQLKQIDGVEIEGIYTHFANIEDTTDHVFAQEQLRRFNEAKAMLAEAGIQPEISHSACSAAAVLFPETHFDQIRLGISLYGLWSSKETRAIAQSQHELISLKPALTWKTLVVQTKKIPAGTAVGYGLTERVSRPTTIAVLPVGYWDGYDRGLSSIGTVLINGTRCKVIGRICMNIMMVDATDVSEVKAGNEAVLLGKQGGEEITADEIAGKIGTINYEVVTRINPLIQRTIVE